MVSAFDGRLVSLTIQAPEGKRTFNQDFSIQASGCKYANAIPGQLQVRIFNLTREMQNYILTEASPMARSGEKVTPINVSLDIGRESTGLFRFYDGYAFQCGMTQPPDIGIMLRALTNSLQAGVLMGASSPQQATLQGIAHNIAANNNLTLSFQSTQGEKLINNWSVSGSLQQQIESLGMAGGVYVFVDGNTLVVMDTGKTRDDSNILISAETGMVGIPQVMELGVMVRVMVNPAIKVGCGVTIESQLNTTANRKYWVEKLHNEITSRDTPF